MSSDRMWRLGFRRFVGLAMLLVVSAAALPVFAQTSPHGKLSIACENCHTAADWKALAKPMKFDHAKTKFALKGQHDQVACQQCHTTLVFSGTSTKCADCHSDVHNKELGTNCERCHSPQTWAVADMIQRHAQTRFTLLGRHRTAACVECHTNEQKHEFVSLPTDCYGCHRVQYEATTVPSHRAVGFGTDCAKCHAVTAMRFEGSFDHSKTNFPLVGAHAAQSCASCHAGNTFASTSVQCFSCHKSDFTNAANPKHGAGFSTDCSSCHTMNSWHPATFDHNTQTSFKLSGAHMSVTCADCHTGGQYAGTVVNCVGCHLKDVQSAVSFKHTSVGTDCASCHTCDAWNPASFDHSKANFVLTGAHATVACAQCHKNNQFTGTPQTCNSCHQTDFTSALNPKHTGFPTDCVTCHSTSGWHPSTFDHNKVGFPLTAAHASVACVQCHVNGRFAGTPTTCIGCHQTDFTNAKAPSHAGFPNDCTTCHTMNAWQPASFDHNKVGFALTGAHTTVACAQCHVNGKFAGTPTTCIGCHQTDFTNANAPPHSGFSTDCTTCHTMNGWQPATFDHSKVGFNLTGAHTTVACAQCHVNGKFAGTPATCIGCHNDKFTTVTNPPHTGFSTDCTTCHTTAAWQPASFDHSKVGFPLTGAHASPTIQCVQCHKNNIFPGTPMTCDGCHHADFTAAVNPSHVGFPIDCVSCHTTTGWHPATFDHASKGFPLTGAHAAVACAQCHANNRFAGTPMTCVGCHQTDFTNTTNPKHTGFSTDCVTCHTTSAWRPANFDHSKVGFPLTNTHAALPCIMCHKNNVYAGTPTTCIGCHQADFTAARNPRHTGYPTDCSTCHGTSTWHPSTFSHNKVGFPLVGAHASVSCVQCHATQFAGTPMTCIGCHQKDFTAANAPPHTGFSTDCTTCHTMNSWQPATFDHSKTAFPLVGAHQAVTCQSCHVNGNFTTLPTTCIGCHQTDFSTANAPPHTGFSNDCTTCHTMNAWQPATFDHSKTPFPLTGAHLTVTPCATCHVNNVYVGLSTACVSCHQTDYNKTNNPVHATAGFGTDCQTCHTTAVGWPSTWNHSVFPLTHGNANSTCNKCHLNPADYSTFTCVSSGCHANIATSHPKVTNFTTDSPSCLRCHPNGRGG